MKKELTKCENIICMAFQVLIGWIAGQITRDFNIDHPTTIIIIAILVVYPITKISAIWLIDATRSTKDRYIMKSWHAYIIFLTSIISAISIYFGLNEIILSKLPHNLILIYYILYAIITINYVFLVMGGISLLFFLILYGGKQDKETDGK